MSEGRKSSSAIRAEILSTDEELSRLTMKKKRLRAELREALAWEALQKHTKPAEKEKSILLD